jgi:hypothetical protein
MKLSVQEKQFLALIFIVGLTIVEWCHSRNLFPESIIARIAIDCNIFFIVWVISIVIYEKILYHRERRDNKKKLGK